MIILAVALSIRLNAAKITEDAQKTIKLFLRSDTIRRYTQSITLRTGLSLANYEPALEELAGTSFILRFEELRLPPDY